MDTSSSSSSETRRTILYTPTGSDFTDFGGCIDSGSDRQHSTVIYLDCGNNNIIRMTGSLTMSGPVRRTDWAEQESSQSSAPSYPPDTKVKEPCLWRFEGETYFKAQVDHQGDAAVDPSRLPSQARPRMARAYSIATLLKIGQLKQFAHVELRISPDALTGKTS